MLARIAQHIVDRSAASSMAAVAGQLDEEIWQTPLRLSPPFFQPPSCTPDQFDAPPLARVIDAHPDPTPSQVAQYQRDGYLVVDNWLNTAQLLRLRRCFESAFEQTDFALPSKTPQRGTAKRGRPDVGSRSYTQRVNPHMTHAPSREIVFEMGRVTARFAAGLNEHPRGYRLSVSQFLPKEPGGAATKWHMDVPQWPFDTAKALTAWIAVDDSTVANGCLHFLRGSARALALGGQSLEEIRTKRWATDKRMAEMSSCHLNDDDEYPELEGLPIVPCPVAAGSVIFHNALGCHGAPPNTTSAERRAMLIALMPNGTPHDVFNGQQSVVMAEDAERLVALAAREGAEAARLTERLGNEGRDGFSFPLLWAAAGHR